MEHTPENELFLSRIIAASIDLEVLDLSDNDLVDLSQIFFLRSLRVLFLQGNPKLKKDKIAGFQEQNPECLVVHPEAAVPVRFPAQSKALPKLGSFQLAALPVPELNTEPLALTGVDNDVVLPDMEFKPSVVFEAIKVNPLTLRKNPKERLDYIDRLGGSQETEKAVRSALDWFTRNQEKSGA